jgi:endonuclease/exonuclease/phosphatase (EEP) superfamily protein YafD
MPRAREFGRWLGRQLHRESESWWWLAPTLLGWLGLIAAAVGLGAHVLTTGWQPLIVLAAFAHQLMWGVIVAVVLFVVTRRWWAMFIALVLFSGVAATQAGLYISGQKPGSGPRIVLLQANLRFGTADPAAVVRMVRSHHVDIATTEELTTSERDRLVGAGLTAELPYHFDAPLPAGGGGLAIWSRYPLSAEVNYPGYELGVLSATVDVPGHDFTVVAVHLLPPYPHPSSTWTHEIKALKTLLVRTDSQHRSVVVGGDFNATVDTGQFRQLLTDGFGDVAEEVGAGYLPTYPADRWFPPVIAIDHVLTANVQSVHLATVALPGSDHRGLLATFER